MSSKLLNIVSDEKVTRGDACSFGSQGKALVKEEPAIVADKDFAGNVLLVTLGCAKNLVDSEVMLGVLKEKGFRAISDPENADLIVVNTCSFLESAVKEGIDRILELAKYKETARCRKLVVAGCMVERYREDLKKSLPEVDKFISTDELLKVADDEDTSEDALSESRRPYFIYDESMPRVRSTLGHTSFVKIAEGCDRPCAFCIIPKIRGSFRSRSINSVYSEISQLYSEGVKEINLVAQDLTSYGVDFADQSKKEPQLVQLLEKLSGITTDNLWLRLLYAYPIGVTERLIKTIENSPIVCNYLVLPLQHISNSVLKRMNRPLGERG
nr:MiaB/RimO family radical SAM methylthiotransferase [Pseudomonadota bacterium]